MEFSRGEFAQCSGNSLVCLIITTSLSCLESTSSLGIFLSVLIKLFVLYAHIDGLNLQSTQFSIIHSLIENCQTVTRLVCMCVCVRKGDTYKLTHQYIICRVHSNIELYYIFIVQTRADENHNNTI